MFKHIQLNLVHVPTNSDLHFVHVPTTSGPCQIRENPMLVAGL
uniref:Uncharacterized protein n=1 Tax=Arundo donax TaxID=35708 RepID=A0A0A9C7I1_ARUDO